VDQKIHCLSSASMTYFACHLSTCKRVFPKHLKNTILKTLSGKQSPIISKIQGSCFLTVGATMRVTEPLSLYFALHPWIYPIEKWGPHFHLSLALRFPKRCYTHVFSYKKKVYKKMRLKSSKSEGNRKKITRLNFQKQVFL